jgi:hypothetical protein
MTLSTQSNAVFRKSIILHIVYVMDMISVFFTKCASVIVSFSNKSLKSIGKTRWIWFIRNASAPHIAFFSALTVRMCLCARTGTIIKSMISGIYKKFFPTTGTIYESLSALPSSRACSSMTAITARIRTKPTYIRPIRINKIFFLTKFTNLFNLHYVLTI